MDIDNVLDEMKCRDYQKDAVRKTFECFDRTNSTLVVLPTGCHTASQGILMFDGTIKRADSIETGDQLMGPDSTPRTVLQTIRGAGRMLDIVPTKGDTWRVNEDHILSLEVTNSSTQKNRKSVEVSVCDWMNWGKTAKHIHKQYRCPVDFQQKVLPIDPYVLGVILGDGSLCNSNIVVSKPSPEIREEMELMGIMHGFSIREHNVQAGKCPCFGVIRDSTGTNTVRDGLEQLNLKGTNSGTKFIPHEYKTSSLHDRLRILAGLMDTDGSVTDGGFDFVSKSKSLADDVAFICRSVGLAAYVKECQKSCQGGFTGTYHRVSISGDCSVIPTLIPNKQAKPRSQKKSVLRTGFTVVDPKVTELYYGWTVDKDNLYLLEDFTVTHNCGKTHVASSICKVWEHQKRGRILWVAHRKELIEQAANSIFRLTGEHPAIEMADNSSMEWGLLKRSSIVVASIQTLMSGRKCSTCEGTGGVLEPCEKCDGKGCDDPKCEKRGTVPSDEDCPHCLGGRRRRLQKFRPDEFTLVVIDECHHATASTYRRVTRWMQQNKQAKLLGLTATPDRADESALGCVFKSIAANIDMPWAIANGWLVPITQKSITCEHLDFSNIRTTAGDLNQKDLEELLINEESLHEMVAPTVELAGDRKTLVFCVDKNHTKLVCELINRYKPTSARYILGCTSDTERDQNFKDHKAGAFQFLVNCGVTTEGYDDPAIQVVAIMRPTKSRSLYVQMCGRGTRPIDPPIEEIAEQRVFAIQTSEKPEVLILDYVGNSGRHKLITSFDLFDGTYPPNVLDRAKRISEQAEEELPTEEVIKRAARELEEEEKKRIEEEERKRREFLKAKAARYVSQSIDPFAWWDTLPDRFATPTQGEPASDAQTGALSRMGVEPFRLSNITSKQASVMLKTLVERKEKGLASYKQSKILKKNGMSPDVTFKQAGAIIDALAKNHWRMNDYIRSMAPAQATVSAE